MKKSLTILFIICVLLASCGRYPTMMTTTIDSFATSTQSNAPGKAINPRATQTETITKSQITNTLNIPNSTLSATLTISATPKLPPTPIPGIIQNCMQIGEEYVYPTSKLNGIIAIQSKDLLFNDSYLLNLFSGEIHNFPDNNIEYLLNGAASPNGEHFAYIGFDHPNSEHRQLFITTPTGMPEKEIDLSSVLESVQNSKFIGWINNNSIILLQSGENPSEGITVILNPFTGDLKRFYSAYRDIYTFYPDFISKWGEYNATLSVYNVSLDHVLYLSVNGIVLWDLINKQPIKIFEDSPDNIINRPVWTPDGENFVIDLNSSSGRNLYLVSKDGEERQLTDLEGRKSGDFIDFAWSPNGRSIAFWLYSGKESHGINYYYDLTILDLSSHEMKNLCITAYNWRSTYPDSYPIWSTDGENLLVAVQDPTDPQSSWSMVVDIANSIAFRIADNSLPMGWLKAP